MSGDSDATVQRIDAQVHTWLPKWAPGHPWADDHPTSFFETAVTPHSAERVVADMDAAGVDAAVTVVPRLYGWDNGYALDAARRFPDRLAVVGRLDWKPPDHRERLRRLMAEPGMIGIRVTNRDDPDAWSEGGAFEQLLSAAEELEVPVSGTPGPRNLEVWQDVARRHDGLTLIVDHLGMEAPPTTVPRPGPTPFAHLPALLALAHRPNVYVKLTAAGALSNEPFPFEDIWPAVRQILDSFGPERVMWGTDYNRTRILLSYDDGVHYLDHLGLEEGTLQQIFSKTLTDVFAWNPAPKQASSQ
jgi:predicted TIM-barrel fold metal-dependent hydrolase